MRHRYHPNKYPLLSIYKGIHIVYTSPLLTKYHQELTGTALYWLSTTKYQLLLSFSDPVTSSYIPSNAQLSQLDLVKIVTFVFRKLLVGHTGQSSKMVQGNRGVANHFVASFSQLYRIFSNGTPVRLLPSNFQNLKGWDALPREHCSPRLPARPVYCWRSVDQHNFRDIRSSSLRVKSKVCNFRGRRYLADGVWLEGKE